MLCALGDIKFELLQAPNRVSGEETFEYAEQKVIQGKPRLQWTGDGPKSFSLPIRFHIDFCDPQTEVDRIRQAARDHLALPLVWGTGKTEGHFVIPKIGLEYKHASEGGRPVQIDLTLELKEFRVDADATKPTTGKAVRTPSGTPGFAYQER